MTMAVGEEVSKVKTLVTDRTTAQESPGTRLGPLLRYGIAAIYFSGAIIHTGLALFRPSVYRQFADESAFGWVRDAWRDIFMAEPRLWALLLAAGELLIAVLLLTRAMLGYVLVVLFTVSLVLFGWGFLLWSGPFLAAVLLAMILERRSDDER
jgi:hypothetical protein